MASRFSLSDVGAASIPGPSFSTPLLFNGFQFGGTISGSGWENFSSDVRKSAQEIIRADIDWRYEHEARVTRELVRVKSIESTPAPPFINSNMLYSSHGHRFGYEQLNPFLGGYPANASSVNSMPRPRQETGNFTGYGNEVFSHYASSHNRDLRGIRVLRNLKYCRRSQADVKRNCPIMKLPEADVVNKLTAVRASLPESEIPSYIPLQHCPEGSREGKMSCYGSVTSGNEQIFPRPEASITRKLPSDNHSVSEILIKANIHNQKEEKGLTSGNEQIFRRPEASITRKLPSDNHAVSEILIKAYIHNEKEEKGWRKENLINVSSAKAVNSESHLLHQLDDIENSSPWRSVCANGNALPENSKKRKRRRYRLRKSMKKKTHSALEPQSSIPGDKAVEELSCSFSKAKTSLCSVEAAQVEGKHHNAEGGSSTATKGIKERGRYRLRKSMKKKTHSVLETQPSIPGDKAVEELSCSSSKAETSLFSVEAAAHVEGKKQNAEGGSFIATKGIKKVKNVTKKFKDGMKKVKKFKRVSKISNHDDRKFWCEMCNVRGMSETLMLIHRNGRKHLKKLRKNHGAVLVVCSTR